MDPSILGIQKQDLLVRFLHWDIGVRLPWDEMGLGQLSSLDRFQRGRNRASSGFTMEDPGAALSFNLKDPKQSPVRPCDG